MKTAFLVATLVTAPLTCISAHADILILNDGGVYHGEVVEETRFTINFRYSENSIWATRTFDRRAIDRVIVEEGDQSDAGLPPAPPEQIGEMPEDARDPNAVYVAVIPLHGQVGGVVRNEVAGTFDAAGLVHCLEEAERQKADMVILDIDSPGGLVSEMEAICDAILEWHGRMRIVAYTHDAFSAAAIITMCCKEIAVRPDSRIGAATIISQDGRGGVSALDAKFASPHYARQRQYMQQSGHPYEVVQAMTIQETELWWSPARGFITQTPPDPHNWQQIDRKETILTMIAQDATRYGVADFEARDTPGLLRELKVPLAHTIDMQPTLDQYNKDLDFRYSRLRDNFTNYFTGLGTLVTKMNTLFDAYKDRDDASVRSLKREIPREVAKIRNAGTQILRSDRSLLARRFPVPDEFIARIESDNELVAGISRLIDSTSTDGWSEAADRLNEVLEEWRELLGM